MALTGALFSGVSGINTNGNAMNIIGDNIANLNTIGFKASRPVFFDLLSAQVGETKVGTGSRLAASQRLFVQGGVETTNNPTDMTVQGSGLFVLQDEQGGHLYSRAGQFLLDENGNLVNPAGLKVQGLELDSDGNPVSGLTNIVINRQILIAPKATTTIGLIVNLDATDALPVSSLPADAVGTEAAPTTWFTGANFSTVLSVFDSLGQAHELTFVFRKTTTNNLWEYRVLANGGEVSGGTSGQLRQVSGAGGRLAFNNDGSLNLAGSTITDIGPITWANGSATQTIVGSGLKFAGSTQFAEPSSLISLSDQDGSASGTLTAIHVGTDGIITGLFSSGRTQPLYRVALANFANPEGLTHVGNSLFSQSPASGQVLFGSPGEGGFGTILSGSLELSTVDLAAEFVRMVTTQRGFQASARTITVTDSLLEEISNLKR